jgi:outer membrane protein W
MKKSMSILLILAAVQAGAATGQASSAKAINISTAALSLSGTTIQTDFAVSDKTTAGPILGVASYSSNGSTANGLTLGASVNHMFTSKIFTDGWSVNSNVQYTNVKSSDGTSNSGYFIGAMAQNNWFWENGFNMNAGIGLQYVSLDLTGIGLKLTGVLPELGFNVGYVF